MCFFAFNKTRKLFFCGPYKNGKVKFNAKKRGMSIRWQMNCCLCCGGPTTPSRESMRRDKLVARCINFIEGDAIRNASVWNLAPNTQPTLISDKQELHLFHSTHVIPVMKIFKSGAANDVWLDDDTPGYQARNFEPTLQPEQRPSYNLKGTVVDRKTVMVLGINKSKSDDSVKAVQWKSPKQLKCFAGLANVLVRCYNRLGKIHVLPNWDFTVPGCQMCNDIMTQQATSSHFLVRTKISDEPLVKAESIFSFKLIEGGKKYSSGTGSNWFKYEPSPEDLNKRASAFNYQACLAYYVHRCLPKRPTGHLKSHKKIRHIMIAFSFLVLEVACLTFERFKGLEGMSKPLRKPAYRYRGCSEVYLSYIFYLLICNDLPDGETLPDDKTNRPGSSPISMDFCQFHRYFFTEVVDTLALSHPEYANAFELNDVVFGGYKEYFLNAECCGMNAGDRIPTPKKMLSQICKSIGNFYEKILRPVFGRHVAGLMPNPKLIGPTATEQDLRLYAQQLLVSNRIVSTDCLRLIMHLLEKSTEGDIDSYVECVGVHAVFSIWQRMLETAPVNVERLMGNFMDSLTLVEYRNVQASMSPDPSRPSIPMSVAEAMYVMCNVLELGSDPRSQQEVEELKQCPKCSPPKSVLRLNQIGAFRPAEE